MQIVAAAYHSIIKHIAISPDMEIWIKEYKKLRKGIECVKDHRRDAKDHVNGLEETDVKTRRRTGSRETKPDPASDALPNANHMFLNIVPRI